MFQGVRFVNIELATQLNHEFKSSVNRHCMNELFVSSIFV